MKRTIILLTSFCAAVVMVLLSGCATTHQTEDMLLAAGFRAQPAATAEQQAHLKSLPAHKVSSVQRNGKQYFVYPDVAHQELYIGQSAQYEQYKKLRQQKSMAEEASVAPLDQMMTQWSLWGEW